MKTRQSPYPLLTLLLASVVLIPAANSAADETLEEIHPCGSLANAYGPFDYRKHKGQPLINIVEQYHFTPDVEQLRKPMFQYFAADFDYTLRAVPNHHRALVSMAKYSEKINNPQPPGAQRTVDCYFDRAMRFAVDDLIVRMIYAGHLTNVDRPKDALVQLDYVKRFAGENPLTHYNLGMLYFDAGNLEASLAEAHLAQQLGMRRVELRDKLVKAGKWRDPEPLPQTPLPAQSSASVPGVSASTSLTK